MEFKKMPSQKKYMLNKFFQICLVAFFVLFTSNVFACSFITQSIFQRYLNADIVFQGKLEKVRDIQNNKLGKQVEYLYFSVEKIWKGSNKKEIILYQAGPWRTSCDVNFVQGNTYIVYGYLNRKQSDEVYSTRFPAGTYAILNSKNEKITDPYRGITVEQELKQLNLLSKTPLWSKLNSLQINLAIFSGLIIAAQLLFVCLTASIFFIIKFCKKEYSNYISHRTKVLKIITCFLALIYLLGSYVIVFLIPA